MSSPLLCVDARLPVVAVDFMRREGGGALLQRGGKPAEPSRAAALPCVLPPSLRRGSPDAPEADGRVPAALPGTTGSLLGAQLGTFTAYLVLGIFHWKVWVECVR